MSVLSDYEEQRIIVLELRVRERSLWDDYAYSLRRNPHGTTHDVVRRAALEASTARKAAEDVLARIQRGELD